MKYGVNSGLPGSGLWQEIYDAVGPFPGYRCYSTPTQGLSLGFPRRPAGASFVIASPRFDIAEFLSGALDGPYCAYVAGAETGDWIACWHEGETPSSGSGATPASLKEMHAKAYKLTKSVRPDVMYGQIVSCYSVNPRAAQYPLAPWIARRANHSRLDFYGADGYRRLVGQTIDNVFGETLRQIRSVVPRAMISITEVNALAAWREQWLSDAYTWAEQQGSPVFFPWFGTETNEPQFAWDPTDVGTIEEMRTQVASS